MCAHICLYSENGESCTKKAETKNYVVDTVNCTRLAGDKVHTPLVVPVPGRPVNACTAEAVNCATAHVMIRHKALLVKYVSNMIKLCNTTLSKGSSMFAAIDTSNRMNVNHT